MPRDEITFIGMFVFSFPFVVCPKPIKQVTSVLVLPDHAYKGKPKSRANSSFVPTECFISIENVSYIYLKTPAAKS